MRSHTVKITPQRSYKVEFPDGSTEVMRLDSEWEGMAALKSDAGLKLIIGSSPDGVNLFLEMFGLHSSDSTTATVVKASPALHARMESAPPAKPPPPPAPPPPRSSKPASGDDS